ncbi:uncharacterized protein AB675_4971 [Cyphellophora attinorum]|uniref:Uncharacterized protein n=1 Tax=Cyphellophora attinorum TaxID=1664694 RepID=A0A0N0NLH3_9EURO|nr:uncharacterized protein AB675_4971 [Phialophora attinorum]KPI39301.1 hypothetical protein AB675_4971 [Phialophora attinorum]
MKDTLRRKGSKLHKSVDLDITNTDTLQPPNNGTNDNAPRHSRSISTASVMPGGTGEKNPWDDEVSASSPIRPTKPDDYDDRGRAQNLDLPGTQRNERSVSEKPTRRRKKTLNQVTPHRFELVDAKRDSLLAKPPSIPIALRPSTPTDSLTVSKTRSTGESNHRSERQKLVFSQHQTLAESEPILPAPPKTSKKAKTPRPQKRSFSRIIVSANITPVGPRPPSPPQISLPASPKRSKRTSSYDFIGDFGLGRDRDRNNPFTASPVANARPDRVSLPSRPLTTTRQPYLYRPPSDPLPTGSLFNKVVVITHGASALSAALLTTLHRAHARIIFSTPPDLAPQARLLIRSLGPPDTIHFNSCDLASYSDIHALFALALTMYGRVDHAVFAPGDDGGHARTVGVGEKLWGLDTGMSDRRNMTDKAELESIESFEPRDYSASSSRNICDVIGVGIRFARIAVGYLRNSPGRRQTHHSNGDSLSPVSAPVSKDSSWSEDRSLTFISSTAAFMPVPYLPVYSTAQHALLGLVRSLATSMDYGRDGVRVNMVATNMLLPSAVETNGGGRTSVQLPTENGEDVGHIIAGLIGNASADSEYRTGEQEEAILHGRILYAMGREAVDIQDGLNINERSWLGDTGKDAYDRASGNANGNEAKGRWMLMDALDSPTLF